jgi:hypothetical protein
MFLSRRITVTASTTEAAPSKTWIRVPKHVIHFIDFDFPPGCMGLVHARVFDGGHPVFPSTADEDIAGDGKTVGTIEFYDLKDSAGVLRVEAWNDDDTYAHTITLHVGILERKYLMPEEILATKVTSFLRMFRLR